jgi:hypothetical protein
MNTRELKRAKRREYEIGGWAWRTFALTYPHEAYATWPARFLRYARQKSGLTDAQIIKALEDAAGAK